MPLTLPIDAILAGAAPAAAIPSAAVLGQSRRGRPILGYRLGRGALRISLIAGCHADEPVGPAMLDRLAAHLAARDDEHHLQRAATWSLVPHVNPDGDAANARWAERTVPLAGGGQDGHGYDLGRYLRHAVREAPGDDVEFGFPRHAGDRRARPENRAVAAFLDAGGPFHLHASFHGMAFAAGPWFLQEAAWAARTAPMRDALRRRVRAMGYRLHDVDRGGEKGFHRIDEGFTTRPDSRAMAAHFEALGQPRMAARFRPSSMEHVRALGGDPLTLVSEMPLFLLPAEHYQAGQLVRPDAIHQLSSLAVSGDHSALAAAARRLGVRPMPIADQMRLQLAYLEEALRAIDQA